MDFTARRVVLSEMVTYCQRFTCRLSEWAHFNVYISSFTGASNGRNDGMSVIRVTYSTCLVYKFSDLRTFNFWHTKAIDCRSEYCVYSSYFNVYISSFTGVSNGRNDGMSMIRVTYSTCLVYKFSDLRTFDFGHTKAIDCRSEYFTAISMCIFLHSQERPMEGMMVWVWSEWPILRVWCINFQI